LRPFVPILKNPHLLTIAGNYWPRKLDLKRFPVDEKLYPTEPGVQVLVHSQHPQGDPRAQLILVHGLEGSSTAGYATSLAQAALQAGYAVHRFNMRSCGGTEAFCGDKLYHSGQTCDVLAVARELRKHSSAPLYLIGFSLGGNVVLKLAGELGERADELIAGVCAVSTPIDLAACVERLNLRANTLYARRFVRRLKQRVRRKAQSAAAGGRRTAEEHILTASAAAFCASSTKAHRAATGGRHTAEELLATASTAPLCASSTEERLRPGLFDLSLLNSVKTIYDFDDVYTAPAFGFGTADNYYATQSAQRFLDDIRVPALAIQAQDDPLVPFEIYNHPAFSRNPNLQLIAPEHGGHVGFISRRKPRFWLDSVLLEWLQVTGSKLQASFVL